MRKWRGLLLCLVLIGGSVPLWAQSNALLDQLLSQNRADFGDAVYLVMTAAKLVPDTASVSDAVSALTAQPWKVKILDAAAPITVGEYSYLLMRAFKLHGGIMYSIVPGPRYAARELAYLNILVGDTSPYRTLSGREVVQILGNVLSRVEAKS